MKPPGSDCLACASGYHDFVVVNGVKHHRFTVGDHSYTQPCERACC